ncbi:MAG: hypothetical protein KDC92_04230 [Bacteroidetes bacterium]|nr:hypothetical protein [Bacteroidota bacterium]
MKIALFKKPYLRAIIWAVCIALIPSSKAFAQKKYLLEYMPKKGTKGEMIMKMDMEIEMSLSGMEMNTTTSMGMGSNLEVAKTTASETTTELTITYMTFSMKYPFVGGIEYDSRTVGDSLDEMTQTLHNTFNEILNEKSSIVQDRSGKTISMEMSESMEQMQSGQNNGGFGMAMSMSAFPSYPLAIGDTWTQTIDDTSSFMKITNTYTLKSVKGGKVTIDFVSDVVKNEAFTGEETIKTVSGTQQGTVVYREKDMWMSNFELNQDLKMTAVQMEMEVPMTTKSKITMKVE